MADVAPPRVVAAARHWTGPRAGIKNGTKKNWSITSLLALETDWSLIIIIIIIIIIINYLLLLLIYYNLLLLLLLLLGAEIAQSV